jgi:hypothetical protein
LNLEGTQKSQNGQGLGAMSENCVPPRTDKESKTDQNADPKATAQNAAPNSNVSNVGTEKPPTSKAKVVYEIFDPDDRLPGNKRARPNSNPVHSSSTPISVANSFPFHINSYPISTSMNRPAKVLQTSAAGPLPGKWLKRSRATKVVFERFAGTCSSLVAEQEMAYAAEQDRQLRAAAKRMEAKVREERERNRLRDLANAQRSGARQRAEMERAGWDHNVLKIEGDAMYPDMECTNDPYKCLVLHKTADLSQVRKRYRKLALMFHPDKNASELANKAFCVFANAYRRISQGGGGTKKG